MSFPGGVGSGDWKRVFFVALTAGLVLVGVMTSFMSSVLNTDCPSVYAQAEVPPGQEAPAKSVPESPAAPVPEASAESVPASPAEPITGGAAEGGSDHLFFYMALVLGIACIGLVLAVLALIRKSISAKNQADRNEELFAELKGSVESSLESTFQKVVEMAGISREVAIDQKEELRRYQEGYTLGAKRSLIKGVIKAIDYIDRQKFGLKSECEELDTTRQYLSSLLFNHGVVEFGPPLGESFNEHAKKNSRFESEVVELGELKSLGLEPVSTGRSSGEIVRVIYSGYRLEEQELEEANHIIIRPAQVMVSSEEKRVEGSD